MIPCAEASSRKLVETVLHLYEKTIGRVELTRNRKSVTPSVKTC